MPDKQSNQANKNNGDPETYFIQIIEYVSCESVSSYMEHHKHTLLMKVQVTLLSEDSPIFN